MQKIGGCVPAGWIGTSEVQRDSPSPCSSSPASASIVGARKIAPSGRSSPSACSIAANRLAATIEVTPRSKKLSVTPIGLMPSSRSQIAGELLLERGPRRDELVLAGALARRLRQRLAVDLAVRRQRERFERRDCRRDHVGGQLLRRGTARSACAATGNAAGDHVRRELGVALARRAPRPRRCRPPHDRMSTVSISPSSMRKPRTLTWWSMRPRYSTRPVRRGNARGRRSGTSARRRRRRRDRRRTAPRSGRADRGSRARRRRRRSTARRRRRREPGCRCASRM